MLNTELANLLAWYFHRHLVAEMQKNEELMLRKTSEGDTFRENMEKLLAKLVAEFPEASRTPEAPFNFTEKWTEIAFPGMSYWKSTYKAFNHVHLARLIDLRDGSQAARAALIEKISQQILTGSSFGKPIDFRTFFAGEKARRTVYIQIAMQHGLPQTESTAIILEQFDAIAECLYEYFDSRLTNALRKSDELLLSILPRSVMEQLKEKGTVEPVYIENASVVFTDFQGFTSIAGRMPPREIVDCLDECFTAFDEITERHGLEKIKTIGDAYMCAAGVPNPDNHHALQAVRTALAFRDWIAEHRERCEKNGKQTWRVRIGVHSGNLVAGVIGKRKFIYDVWGDTVNIASRMESAGLPDSVNISRETFNLVQNEFLTESRGSLDVKNKGAMEMFLVTRAR
ncbi:MAG: adenylate/guanylate cyclase domain-containing protein [Leptospirales bacterium]|nr:adenylate/guanylate cyclase domain-containing protein [Leptospirales bacterium]